MTAVIDRRAARTRKALHQALMSLIVSRGYDAITVQDVIDQADVGRSTFYAHYTGKDDLLRSGFDELRSLLTEAAKPRDRQGQPLSFSLAMFEHACDYKDVYRALVGGRGGSVAINEIRHVLSDAVRKELATTPDDDLVPREVRVQFVVATMMTVLSASLGRKSQLPPDRMDAIFRRLVMHGLSAEAGRT